MIKNKYRDDYSRFARLNGKGRVVDDICYTGEYYILPFGKEQKKKTNVVNIGVSLLLLLLHIAAGMVNQDSSRTFWIVYPYLFVFLPLAYMLVGAVNYVSAPLRMQRAQYETGLARIRRSCMGAMALAGISAALDLVYIFLHFSVIQIGKELCYFLCQCLSLAISFFYGRYYDKAYGGITARPAEKGKEP